MKMPAKPPLVPIRTSLIGSLQDIEPRQSTSLRAACNDKALDCLCKMRQRGRDRVHVRQMLLYILWTHESIDIYYCTHMLVNIAWSRFPFIYSLKLRRLDEKDLISIQLYLQ
jgi:hypothetical protein